MEVLKSHQELEREIEELKQSLEEANDTIEAIRTGQVDAFIVKNENQHQLYTLQTADVSYRLLIERMIEGAVTLDEAGIIVYSNSRFADLLGLPLSQIIGAYFKTFVSGEYRETFDLLEMQGWKSDSKGEIYLISRDNEMIPFLLSLTPVEIDDKRVLNIILTDLSPQKEKERQLRETNEELQAAHQLTAFLNNQLEGKVKDRTKELLTSREHFRFLADTVPIIIWTAGPTGKFDYFNNRWFEYTGKSFEESEGDGWQEVIHPEDRPDTIAEWEHSIRTGSSFKREDRKRSRDGDYYWHLAHALPFKDSTGRIKAWFGVCTDIEEQKNAMEKKDEFISMASHELKTPVTTLKAFTQLLMMTFEQEGNDNAVGMLERMNKQINRLTGLITDLLDASRANSGELNYQDEKFDLNELVREISDEMQRTSPSHTIELVLADLPPVNGDRGRVGQVITNMLSNAIKYSPGASRVIVSTFMEGLSVLCSVQDFGLGIPASQRSKLFTRFFRVSHDKSNTFPGLGLGLYISSEIIKRHGGEMHFQSEEGKGSIFSFSIPLKEVAYNA